MSIKLAFYTSLTAAVLFGVMLALFIEIMLKVALATAALFIGYRIVSDLRVRADALVTRIKLRWTKRPTLKTVTPINVSFT